MSIPKYFEMYQSVMTAIRDGEIHVSQDIKKQVILDFGLTQEDQREMLPSGRQAVWVNRIGWCKTYLKNAGLIETPKRGWYRITKKGKELLDSGENIDNFVLERYPSFNAFKQKKNNVEVEKSSNPISDSETPQEVLERVYSDIHKQLADTLLSMVIEQTSDFFEKMVVDLLKKLGYGESAKGIVTKTSHDEGIDGIVYEDKLGFNLIYVQAKKWASETTVGRPEIQKFVGALAGHGATKGLFITTAQFTKEAIEYASKQHTTKVVLVDGEKLTNLMIDYDFGVTTAHTFKIKKIDSDFFLDE